ncbi:MAG: LysR family transcriptional regulator [Microthrixaceae bacterium]|nr:LysR family transcriptional regulator [Microthrixaceae bacterium]
MDRKQLKALIAVAEHSSFSSAARALGTVQSNVSAHVARLERDMGVTLIDRATNKPTDEGQVVLQRARRIEAEFDALDSDISELRDVISGSVHLGVIGTTALWLVPPLLRALKAEHPEVSVVVLDATTTSMVVNLLTGTVDMAVINLPIDEPELSVEALFDEDRVLIVPEGHELFDRSSVTLAELADHELLLEAKGTSFRDELDRAAEERGTRLRTQAEFDGMRLLASLVYSGYGAGIVPATAAATDGEGRWRSIPIHEVPGRTVGLAMRRRGIPSAAQRVVSTTVKRVITENANGVAGMHLRSR